MAAAFVPHTHLEPQHHRSLSDATNHSSGPQHPALRLIQTSERLLAGLGTMPAPTHAPPTHAATPRHGVRSCGTTTPPPRRVRHRRVPPERSEGATEGGTAWDPSKAPRSPAGQGISATRNERSEVQRYADHTLHRSRGARQRRTTANPGPGRTHGGEATSRSAAPEWAATPKVARS